MSTMSEIDHQHAEHLAQTAARHLGGAVTELRALRDLLRRHEQDNGTTHLVPAEVLYAYLRHAGVTDTHGEYGGLLLDLIRAVEDVHAQLRNTHHDPAGLDASRQALTVRHRLELAFGANMDHYA